jgi:glycosyltransferase involved in cell wall biosynthesis
MLTTDVLCLSHLRWNFVFQRPNHLMIRAAREQRVFFIEEPVETAGVPGLDITCPVADLPNLAVVVPRLAAGLSPDDARRQHRALLDLLALEHAIVRPILWFYTPMALEVARHLDASLVVYDCMDELSQFASAPPALRAFEAELFARADVVFTGGQSLYEAKRGQHANVHAFPSSVDVAHFARGRRSNADPVDQQEIAHPRVGFFGVIDERLDTRLLAELARLRPDLHLVMIGPVVKIDPATLPQAPNLHWLGGKTYDELPSYIGGWDAAMMPFARNAATEFISPTKTLEFIAAGKPVVSTAIRDVVRPYGHHGLVRIADDALGFSRALTAALAEPAGARLLAFDAMLAGTSWDRTWSSMRQLLVSGGEARASEQTSRRVPLGGAATPSTRARSAGATEQ